MTFYERSELFRKYPETPVFDHSNYRLFERIPAVPGTSNNRGLTVFDFAEQKFLAFGTMNDLAFADYSNLIYERCQETAISHFLGIEHHSFHPIIV